jgi:hypothetical protein
MLASFLILPDGKPLPVTDSFLQTIALPAVIDTRAGAAGFSNTGVLTVSCTAGLRN